MQFPADVIKVRRRDGKREVWEQLRMWDLPPPAPAPNGLPAHIRDSPAGMATWAGTDPSDSTCGQCEHFNLAEYGRGWCSEFVRRMKAARQWRPGAAPENAPRFPASTAACRCFARRG